MKKILHVPNYYYPHVGGIEQTARDIVNSLDEKFMQEVICFSGDNKDLIDEVDGIKVVKCGEFKKVASQSLSLSYKKLLKKEIKGFNPDIIVFHYPNPFLAHYLIKYLKKNKNIKFILWWHMDITKQKKLAKLFEGQNQYLLKRADKIVATSKNYLDGSSYLKKYESKVNIIPSCIPDERAYFSPEIKEKAKELKDKNNGKIIVFGFGRHVEYKGLRYLIEASKLLDENYKIYIGGKGPLTNELKEIASNDSKIEFLGFLSDFDLKTYIDACDIFAFPSITKNEGYGLALVEASSDSKPAVTFNIPGSGVNFVGLNGVNAIECENKNVLEYANAIKKLGEDKDLRLEMGSNAKKRYDELFSFKIFKDKVIGLFEEYRNENSN